MSYWEEPEFKQLEKLWYNKLEDEGFEDIEQRTGQRLLKEWDSNFFRNKFNEIRYECTRQYYTKGRELLQTYIFESREQKTIWKLHCDGIPEREIAKQIKSYKKSMVHLVIEKISKTIKRED